MSRRAPLLPAPLLVLGGVVSVQFGGALAASLIPEIGVGGAVFLRIAIAAVILLLLVRPPIAGTRRVPGEPWSLSGSPSD